MAVGVVTTLIVTLIGFIIALIAAVGWFRSVFPTPKHTLYPLAEADRRPAPVKVSPRSDQPFSTMANRVIARAFRWRSPGIRREFWAAWPGRSHGDTGHGLRIGRSTQHLVSD